MNFSQDKFGLYPNFRIKQERGITIWRIEPLQLLMLAHMSLQ